MSIDDFDLAGLLDVLADFAADATQCLNPWPDESLAPVRKLARWLRDDPRIRGAVEFRLIEERYLSERSRAVAGSTAAGAPSPVFVCPRCSYIVLYDSGLCPNCGYPTLARFRPDGGNDIAARIDAAIRRLEDETTAERMLDEMEGRHADGI